MTSIPSWSNRFEIKKDRWVYVPTTSAREFGQKTIIKLRSCWNRPNNYYHLRDGGHVLAIKSHIENNFFATIDLADFYGSISRSRVTRALKKLLDYETARVIAINSTVKASTSYPHQHYLPYGFLQSPIIASICLWDSKLGECIKNLHAQTDIVITVYMDDIIISSNDANKLNDAYAKLSDSVIKSRFIQNDRKSHKPSNSTHAFNIIIKNKHMEIDSPRFSMFKDSYRLSSSEYQREGILSYVASVNPIQALLLD